MMRAATGLSTLPDAAAAAATAAHDALSGLGGARCDLAATFVSADHAAEIEVVAKTVGQILQPAASAGVTAGAIVCGAREVEDAAGVAVFAAHLPGTSVRTFRAEHAETPEGPAILGWPDAPDGAAVLVFADPYSFPADLVLRRLNEEHPGRIVIGGFASGGRGPGTERLWAGDAVYDTGAVGFVVHGDVRIGALVSQGCRPIGDPATVTRADRNIVFEMAGVPPAERVRSTYESVSTEEQVLIRRGLHLGRVVDEYKTDFSRGDFLIRTVMGFDQSTGAMAVGDIIEMGETVQFHVRDAASADEDLRHAVSNAPRPDAVMLFTCNGRGTHLFGIPDHDAALLTDAWKAPALAGFFCAGEIGPVGGKNFLHGFTASAALFYG